ncbi:MAG: ABC transporter permease subunit [Actinomycetota bacterium]|nr:ABC transporter permease subunit [Actinomycetota bacterium]
MLRSVFGETMWSRRSTLLWYAVGMAALVGITVGVYPSVREGADTFTQLLESMPEGMLSFFGSSDVAQLLTPAGFVNSRINASIGAVVLTVFAISLGTAAIAGEEDRRTMDLLLSTPITRARIVVERFLAMVALVGAVAGAVLAVMVIANPMVDLGFSLLNMIASNFELGLLALVFGSLALAVGGLTGKRGVTLGVASGATVASFFINGLASLVSWLEWPQKLTPFYWLQRSDPLAKGLSVEDTLIMLAVIGVFLAIAVWGFQRRDVAV